MGTLGQGSTKGGQGQACGGHSSHLYRPRLLMNEVGTYPGCRVSVTCCPWLTSPPPYLQVGVIWLLQAEIVAHCFIWPLQHNSRVLRAPRAPCLGNPPEQAQS